VLCSFYDLKGWLSQLFDQQDELEYTVKEIGFPLQKGNRKRATKTLKVTIPKYAEQLKVPKQQIGLGINIKLL
jgi:hypothetical protein